MYFENKLPEIFTNLNEQTIKFSEKKDEFLEKITKLLNIWNDWLIYDPKYLLGLEAALKKKNIYFERNDNSKSESIFNFNTTSQIGIRLKILIEKT